MFSRICLSSEENTKELFEKSNTLFKEGLPSRPGPNGCIGLKYFFPAKKMPAEGVL